MYLLLCFSLLVLIVSLLTLIREILAEFDCCEEGISLFLLFFVVSLLCFLFWVVVFVLLLVISLCGVLVQLESVKEFGKLNMWEVLFDIALPVVFLVIGLGVLESEELLLLFPGILLLYL